MAVPLDLFAIRREQRRVAALMQRDVTLPHHKFRRKPLPFEDFLHLCKKFNEDGIPTNKINNKLATAEERVKSMRKSHNGVFKNEADNEYHKYERTMSKSLDNEFQMTRLPSITITNKVTKKVLNEKDKKKRNKSMLFMETGKRKPSQHGNLMEDQLDDDIVGGDSGAHHDDSLYDSDGDPIGHLRYQHGVMTNLPEENNGFLLSRENTDATSSALFRIASYDNTKGNHESGNKGYCTCAHPSFGSCQQCKECGNIGDHAKWCSRSSTSFQVACNHCGKLIKQEVSSSSSKIQSNTETTISQRLQKQSSTTSVSSLKSKRKNRKRKVKIVTDVESIDSGLDRSETRASSIDDITDHNPEEENPTTFLENLDKRIAERAFDFEAKVNINDVDTKFYLAGDDSGMELEDVDMGDAGIDAAVAVTENEENENVIVTKKGGCIYKNGVREAYLKALSAVFSKKTVMEPFYLNRRISAPYVTSYYSLASQGAVQTGKLAKKSKSLPPMKIIFGKTNVDDYFPGGKMNPKKVFRKKLELKSQSTTVLQTLDEEKDSKMMLTKSTGALLT